MTPSEKQVKETKICCSCKRAKQLKDFYRNSGSSSGYEGRCKICKKQKLRCYSSENKNKAGRPQLKNMPQLWNVRKKDWIDTFNFLKSLGYELSGQKTIHQQFCEKHNLQPRKRMYEKSIKYTPKDLGLS